MIWSNITWHAIVWYDKWSLWYTHRHSIYPSLRHLPLWPRIPAPVEADERWRYTGGGFDTRRGWPKDIFESNSAFRDKQKSSCFRMYSVKSYDSDPWSNGLLKESDWWLPQISGLPLRPSDRCRSSATCASLRFQGKSLNDPTFNQPMSSARSFRWGWSNLLGRFLGFGLCPLSRRVEASVVWLLAMALQLFG